MQAVAQSVPAAVGSTRNGLRTGHAFPSAETRAGSRGVLFVSFKTYRWTRHDAADAAAEKHACLREKAGAGADRLPPAPGLTVDLDASIRAQRRWPRIRRGRLLHGVGVVLLKEAHKLRAPPADQIALYLAQLLVWVASWQSGSHQKTARTVRWVLFGPSIRCGAALDNVSRHV